MRGCFQLATLWELLVLLKFCQGSTNPQLSILVTDVSLFGGIFKFDIHRWTHTKLDISRLGNPVAIDYDLLEQRVYWADNRTMGIWRCDINGRKSQRIVSFQSTSSPGSLTLDSNTRQIFYTDQSNDVIVRIGMDTYTSTEIVKTGLDNPKGIVADKKHRKLFWVAHGRQAKIETCDYNGGSRRTVVSQGLIRPLGITINELAGRLYWTDGAGYIMSVLVDGTRKKEIFAVEGRLFYDISYFNGFLYYTALENNLNNDVYHITEDGLQDGYMGAEDNIRHPVGIHVFSPNWNNTVCPNGKHGYNCDPCGKCWHGTFCEKTTGVCLSGCDPGYKDHMCLEACDLGTYGQTCKSTCSVNCIGGRCDHVTGNCPDGCLIRWKGDKCTMADDKTESLSWNGTTQGILVCVVMFVIVVAALSSYRHHKKRSQRRGQREEPCQVVYSTSTSSTFTNPTSSHTIAQPQNDGELRLNAARVESIETPHGQMVIVKSVGIQVRK